MAQLLNLRRLFLPRSVKDKQPRTVATQAGCKTVPLFGRASRSTYKRFTKDLAQIARHSKATWTVETRPVWTLFRIPTPWVLGGCIDVDLCREGTWQWVQTRRPWLTTGRSTHQAFGAVRVLTHHPNPLEAAALAMWPRPVSGAAPRGGLRCMAASHVRTTCREARVGWRKKLPEHRGVSHGGLQLQTFIVQSQVQISLH